MSQGTNAEMTVVNIRHSAWWSSSAVMLDARLLPDRVEQEHTPDKPMCPPFCNVLLGVGGFDRLTQWQQQSMKVLIRSVIV